MDKKRYYLFAALCAFTLALIFKFVSVGMGFTASLFVVITIILLIFAFVGDSKKALVFKRIFAVILALILMLALITEVMIFAHAKTTANKDTDWIIILGAGLHGDRISYSLKSRLDRAIEFLDGGDHCRIVVSGGQGQGESMTEAAAMKRYLTANGIDESRIYLEEKATSTEENIAFSFDLISSSGEYGKGDKIAVLSSAYHLYRTSLMVRDTVGDRFGNITYISARTKRFIVVNYYLREIAALWYYIILK